MATSRRVFISHLSHDRELVRRLAQRLVAAGYQPVMAPDHVPKGANWQQWIEKTIATVDAIVIIWSSPRDKDESEFYFEVEKALDRRRKQLVPERFLYTIHIGDEPWPRDDLEKIQCIALPQRPDDGQIAQALDDLVEALDRNFAELLADHSSNGDGSNGKVVDDISANLTRLIAKIEGARVPHPPDADRDRAFVSDINARVTSIARSIDLTVSQNESKVDKAICRFKDWMVKAKVVRVIGVGRARLAASIAANRLAHGGARVYIQDDIIPMPHDIQSGGIVAVSASGRTATVLDILRDRKRRETLSRLDEPSITVVGIADHRATEFADLCDHFIGLHVDPRPNPLQALADTEEYVISMLLDAMVVAAGKRAGFDDTKWRLGHENIGATGPYDVPAHPREQRID